MASGTRGAAPISMATAADEAGVTEGHYIFRSSGGDGAFGTADDVYCTAAEYPVRGQPPLWSESGTMWSEPVASAR